MSFRIAIRVDPAQFDRLLGVGRALVEAVATLATATEDVARALSPPAVLTRGIFSLNGKEFPMPPTGFPVPDNVPQHLSAAWLDQDGNPVVPDSVVYALSDDTMGTLMPDADATTGVTFTPATVAGKLGDVTVSGTATQGAATVVAQGVLTVTASALFSGTLTPDTPAPVLAAGTRRTITK